MAEQSMVCGLIFIKRGVVMSVTLKEILDTCDNLLRPEQFDDYCPNGLQVEGKPQVSKIVSGVSASYALLEAAVEQQADAVLVHHGYFWKGDDPRVLGMLRRRLGLLLAHDISLIAFHLPLDAHADFGNNVQLAQQLDIEITGGLDNDSEHSIGLVGELPAAISAERFSAHIEARLGRHPVHVAGSARQIKTVAWCTGAAQGFIERAAKIGVDAYISGEISEPTTHIARETGVHFFAAGHHATERFGVRALGDLLANRLGVTHQFIDIDNPA